MVSRQQMLVSALLFEFALFPLVASTFAIPNVKNPITDLLPSTNNNAFGIGGGTGQGPSDTVTSQQQSVQSCLVGALPGAIVGGLAGTVVPGLGNLAGFIIGGIAGGGIGCLTASTFFPQQGSDAFNTVTNNLGPIGDFVKALAVALTFIGPMLSFISDSINYELAMFSAAPELAVFLAPIQLITIFLLFFEGALYLRGLGSTG